MTLRCPGAIQACDFPSVPEDHQDQLAQLVVAANQALEAAPTGGVTPSHVKGIRGGFSSLLRESIRCRFEDRFQGIQKSSSAPRIYEFFEAWCYLHQVPAKMDQVARMPACEARSVLQGIYREFLPALALSEWLGQHAKTKVRGEADATRGSAPATQHQVPAALVAEIERVVGAARPEYMRRFIECAEADFASCCASWGRDTPTLRELQRCGYSESIREHYQNIAELLTEGPLHKAALDPERLRTAASAYADRVFRGIVSKLLSKGRHIEAPIIHMPSSYQFTLTGRLLGKPVQVKQDVILNRSVYGKLFEQFPARFTYDGRAISEARLKKMIETPSTDDPVADRLFVAAFPGGLSYADRSVEVDGDFKQLAFLPYHTLELQWRVANPPADLRAEIESSAAEMQARSGESFEVSTSGQTVLLGSAIEAGPGG